MGTCRITNVTTTLMIEILVDDPFAGIVPELSLVAHAMCEQFQIFCSKPQVNICSGLV